MRKISLVTGASRGLGRNAALAIARQGGAVIVTYQQQSAAAAALVAEIEAMGQQAAALQLDTGDVASFPAFVRQLQQLLADKWQASTLDHLVNNAGHGDCCNCRHDGTAI